MVFYDIGVSFLLLVLYAVLDVINGIWRIVVPFLFWFDVRILNLLFAGDKILLGLLGTVVVALMLTPFAFVGSANQFFVSLALGIYFLDGVAQIVGFVFNLPYPASNTFVVTLSLQIPFMFVTRLSYPDRYILLAGGGGCLLWALRLHRWGYSAGAVVFLSLSVVPLLMGVTPRELWRKIWKRAVKVGKAIAAVSSIVFIFSTKIWVIVRNFVLVIYSMFDHTFSKWLKQNIIWPLLRVFGPLVLPSATFFMTL
jgi:hypothetical protein